MNIALPQKKHAARPRDAATLILLDGKGRKTKILLGKRHHGHKFMPGKFVFPGGRVEASDRLMNVAGALDPRDEARLMKHRTGASPNFARALALAAIRETFEETGLVVGGKGIRRRGNPPPGAWSEISAQTVCRICRRSISSPAPSPRPRGPSVSIRAFSPWTRAAIAARCEGCVHEDAELVELVWVGLDEAEKLDLPMITLRVLGELRQRLDGGMSRFAPAPFFYELHGKWRREEL